MKPENKSEYKFGQKPQKTIKMKIMLSSNSETSGDCNYSDIDNEFPN